MRFIPEPQLLLTADRTAHIQLWDLNGKLIGTIRFLGEGDHVVTTPDGRFDASPGGFASVLVGSGLNLRPATSEEPEFSPGLLAEILNESSTQA